MNDDDRAGQRDYVDQRTGEQAERGMPTQRPLDQRLSLRRAHAASHISLCGGKIRARLAARLLQTIRIQRRNRSLRRRSFTLQFRSYGQRVRCGGNRRQVKLIQGPL